MPTARQVCENQRSATTTGRRDMAARDAERRRQAVVGGDKISETNVKVLNAAALAKANPLAPCDQCGDDLQVHDWVRVNANTGDVIDCNRS